MSWLFQTSIRLQTSLDRRFLRFGMTVQEAGVLLRCVEARIITPGQLAVGLGRDKGMITRFIDRLEFSRLIIRDINPRDRRFSVIKPTAITDGYHFPTSPRRVLFEFRRRRMPGSELPAMSGLAVCGKTQNQSPQGPKLDGLHGPYIEAESPAPTYRAQRRGGFSLGLARGDQSGCLRNSSATGYSRCPLSLFAGPAWRPALRRRGR